MRNSTAGRALSSMNLYLQIKNAFYSGAHAYAGSNEVINEIAFLVKEKYLTLSVLTLGSKEEYLACIERALSERQAGEKTAGGSIEHVALKIVAGNYLQRRRLHVQYEHPFCGYYPDAMSKNGEVIIECGHTNNPEKMFTYFRQGGTRECVQLPYPGEGVGPLLGYSFTAGPDLYSFLAFLESEKHSATKDLVMKRKPL